MSLAMIMHGARLRRMEDVNTVLGVAKFVAHTVEPLFTALNAAMKKILGLLIFLSSLNSQDTKICLWCQICATSMAIRCFERRSMR
jgi:hypothetical protein